MNNINRNYPLAKTREEKPENSKW